MPELTITIPGKPIAKQRPRFYRKGQYVGTYNDQHTEEGRWLWEAKGQIPGAVPEGIAVELKCTFCMPIPKSMSKKRRAAMCYHTKKPDLDNLLKFVKDCLNGVAWHDDSQVAGIIADKIYSDNPRTVIRIIELEKGEV